MTDARSRLKKVFSPDIGVDPSPQVLDILKYACGLSLGFALISYENPNFEIASNLSLFDKDISRLMIHNGIWKFILMDFLNPFQ